MKVILKTAAILTLIAAVLFGAVGSVRWAKRGGAAASLMASALVLALGMGLVVKPPQQGVEQAQEEVDREGGESGDPPA
jgi:hypothetical protein